MHAALLAVLALWGASQAADDEAPGWRRFTLAGGLEVACLHAEHAATQAFFTLLPSGLALDGPGEAQFSHLVEHLAIRTTDAYGAAPEDGVLVNGETLGTSTRLETLGPAAAWREALARHAAWLAAAEVDAQALDQARRNIALELESTAANGFTHKWALAAWNQVVRHGQDEVDLAGDMARLSPSQAARHLRRFARPRAGTLLVSVGPVPLDEVEQGLEDLLGDHEVVADAPVGGTLSALEVLQPGDRHARWDLPGAHTMVWFPVPDDAESRVRADALARLVNVRLGQLASLRMRGIEALASADLAVPEGRFLVVSASHPASLHSSEVQAALGRVLDGLDIQAEAGALADQAARQVRAWPDFGALRTQAAGRPGLDWIEAQQVLFVLYAELATGLEREALARLYAELDWDAQAERTAGWLDPGRRSTLVLLPRG